MLGNHVWERDDEDKRQNWQSLFGVRFGLDRDTLQQAVTWVELWR